MNEIRRKARTVGFLYLLLALAAPFRLIYLPSTLIVPGNAAETAARITAHEGLFRLGIVSDLFCGSMLVFILLAFQRLFKDVDRELARAMVIVGGIIPATIYFVNVVNDAAALLLVRGEVLTTFPAAQRADLALAFLRLHGQMVLSAEVLWGLWLFPLALLVIRSGFIPKVLGWWLILNGLAYIAASLTGFLWPHYESRLAMIALPAQMGEVALMLYLLIKGAKEPSQESSGN